MCVHVVYLVVRVLVGVDNAFTNATPFSMLPLSTGLSSSSAFCSYSDKAPDVTVHAVSDAVHT